MQMIKRNVRSVRCIRIFVTQPLDSNWTSSSGTEPSSLGNGSFFWLIMYRKLKTRDKLVAMGVLTTDIFLMCIAFPESIEHQVFQCQFSKLCLHILQKWLAVCFPSTLHRLAIRKWKGSRVRRSLILTFVWNLSYMIQRSQNEAVWQFRMTNIDSVIKKIIHNVRI